MLVEGEFSAAFLMKHFVMLIKAGESIDSGALAGLQNNWLKPADAKALLKKFSTVNKAMRAAVNHTTKIEFVFPPKEMFDLAKFDSSERRIFYFAGVSVGLITEGKGSYSSAYISIKRMMSQMSKGRTEVSKMFCDFFRHITIRTRVATPEGFLVRANFDENALKEPRQILDEVKFLFERSISDPRTACRELGRDPDTIKASTIQSRKEQEQSNVWSGVGSQGKSVSSSPEGRPANEGTVVSDYTRNQPPIAVRGENN